MESFSKENFTAAYLRIKPFIHRTPVLTSTWINHHVGCSVFFKCENFQKTGSFKIRGATNAILQRVQESQQKAVVTHSSGNHAQALSLAAKNLDLPAYIVMPSNAPKVKKDAVEAYGGIITECRPSLKDREEQAVKIMQKYKAAFIHPSNDTDIIVGQGTAALELFEQQSQLDYLITPVGGGGLLAGTALATSLFSRNTEVFGAEPFEVDDAYRSLKSGNIEVNKGTNTIADGLRTNLGDKNFPIIQKHVSGIIRVSEEDIIDCMKLVWSRMKILIEPSSAVALAAVLTESSRFKGKKVGVILSGGNIDLSALNFLNK